MKSRLSYASYLRCARKTSSPFFEILSHYSFHFHSSNRVYLSAAFRRWQSASSFFDQSALFATDIGDVFHHPLYLRYARLR